MKRVREDRDREREYLSEFPIADVAGAVLELVRGVRYRPPAAERRCSTGSVWSL
jgi:hypothetical protein